MKINWFTKILMRFAPKTFLRYVAREQGIRFEKINCLTKLFGENCRIDIFPLSGSGSRGFSIILDNKLSLYFYQDGDHFCYDGYEIGEYEKGNVTIFDNIRE